MDNTDKHPFKVGDMVKIKSPEKIKKIDFINVQNGCEGLYGYVRGMHKYSGQAGKIERIDQYGYINFNKAKTIPKEGENTYKWHYSWLKKHNLFSDEDFLI